MAVILKSDKESIDYLSKVVKRAGDKFVVLSGPSGVGKTRLASLLSKQLKVVDADAYGKKTKHADPGRYEWKIDWDKLVHDNPDVDIISGTGSVIDQGDLDDFLVIRVDTTPDAFRKIASLKARDAKVKKDLPDAWVQRYEEKSKLTNSQIRKYLNEWHDEHDITYDYHVVLNPNVDDIQEGWHSGSADQVETRGNFPSVKSLRNTDKGTSRHYYTVVVDDTKYGVVVKLFEGKSGTVKVWDLTDLDLKKTISYWKTQEDYSASPEELEQVRKTIVAVLKPGFYS